MNRISSKERESNMELLRIISMVMVLVVHADGAALGLPQHPSFPGNSREIWQLGVESASIIGVNCFTLISGYFGIRLRVKSVFSYLFQCIFYAVGIITIAWIVDPANYNFSDWLKSWMVLTHTDLWYVPAYFALMLLSPLINKGMAQLTRRRNLAIVSLFAAYNIWCGWWWGGSFNPTGYTVIQLVMIYMIGRLIALYPRPSRADGVKWLLLYLLSGISVFVSSYYLPAAQAFAYNSPAVILMSVSFFCCFLGLKLKSSVINYLAQSAFAVYLVHKDPVIWARCIKPVLAMGWELLSLRQYTQLVMIGSVAIYLILTIPDYIRRKLSALLLRLVSRINMK